MNKNLLSEVVDYEDGLRRFSGNEALFSKFILKFLDDVNYSKMKFSIEEGLVEDAFKYGHALKGVAGNLSLKPLFESTCVLVDVLRAKVNDDRIIPLLANVTREYDRTYSAISKAR